MRFRPLILEATVLATLALCGCASAPGRPGPGDIPVVPSEVSDFGALYGHNCAGCHGPEGNGGAAIALANPVYLAIADEAILRRATANGVPGTSMPAFAQSAGGMLTDKQIDVIVSGVRGWSKPDILRDANQPTYSSSGPADSTRGAVVYAAYCSSCHGVEGQGGPKASSIVEGSFLALVSDQGLRTIVIAGRPELGAPDWRGNIPGKPMSGQEVSDVVAWLASRRPKYPGQPFPTTLQSMGEIR